VAADQSTQTQDEEEVETPPPPKGSKVMGLVVKGILALFTALATPFLLAKMSEIVRWIFFPPREDEQVRG